MSSIRTDFDGITPFQKRNTGTAYYGNKARITRLKKQFVPVAESIQQRRWVNCAAHRKPEL